MLAVLLIQMNDHLGVTVRGECIPALFEQAAQLYLIEDFAVERHPDTVILIGQRLAPAGNIDNTKSRMPETAVVIKVASFAIWPTMANALHHGVHLARRRRLAAGKAHYSCDSAHMSLPQGG